MTSRHRLLIGSVRRPVCPLVIVVIRKNCDTAGNFSDSRVVIVWGEANKQRRHGATDDARREGSRATHITKNWRRVTLLTRRTEQWVPALSLTVRASDDLPKCHTIVDTGRCTISAGRLVSINPLSTPGRACSDRLSVARRRRRCCRRCCCCCGGCRDVSCHRRRTDRVTRRLTDRRSSWSSQLSTSLQIDSSSAPQTVSRSPVAVSRHKTATF